MTQFPSLSYTLTSEIPTLYTHIPEAGKGTAFGWIPPLRPRIHTDLYIFSIFSTFSTKKSPNLPILRNSNSQKLICPKQNGYSIHMKQNFHRIKDQTHEPKYVPANMHTLHACAI